MAGYPVVVDLAGRRCVVVGGGSVAERKINGLLVAGADVTVVSPTLSASLQELASRGGIRHVSRRYRRGDLAGAVLAFVATGDAKVAEAVAREGRRCSVWVNAADDPEHCDFFLPSVLRRGPLLIAVATGGTSPALARAVREAIERLLPAEYAALAETVADVRRELRARGQRAGATAWSRALRAELSDLGHTSPEEARSRLLRRLTAMPGRDEGSGDLAGPVGAPRGGQS